MGIPILVWSRDDIELAVGAGSSSISHQFSPLATSYGGMYMCTARLTIPLAGVDVTGSNATNVIVQSRFVFNLKYTMLLQVSSTYIQSLLRRSLSLDLQGI